MTVILPTRHVYATYVNPDGTPKHGYVEFVLTTDVNFSNTAIIQVSTVRADLDSNGRIDADLIVSDDPSIQPEGLMWSVEEKMENGNLWYVQIPTGDGSPIDLTNLFVPGLAPPGYGIQGVQGPKGDTGDQGIPGSTTTIIQPDDPGDPTLMVPTGLHTPLWVDTDEETNVAAWVRTTGTLVTGNLAANASQKTSVVLASSYRLLSINSSSPARIRFYVSTAYQDADLTRPIGTDPTGDHGLLLEVVTTPTVLELMLSPSVDGYVNTGDAVSVTVTNTGVSSATISVGFLWIRTE